MNQNVTNLKLAERGALLSIGAYIILSGIKLIAGQLFHSDALRADAFNNISDIIGNIAVLVGLKWHRNQLIPIINLDTGKWKTWQA